MIFLGTGAAEMLPNPFCTCRLCEHARLHPEQMRRRTCFLFDRHTMLDFGPDVLSACHTFGQDLSQLRDVFITHGHEDHFSLTNLNVVTMSRTHDTPFTVHMSKGAYEHLLCLQKAVLQATNGHADMLAAARHGFFDLKPHDFFETFCAGDKTVFTVRGNHPGAGAQERSMHYRITQNGKTLLYATDTGLYEPVSIEALSGFPLDVLIMDATFGSAEIPEGTQHLNGRLFLKQVETLEKCGAVTKDTRIFAAHINHKHDWTHADYQRFFDESGAHPVTVAHDGMELQW